MDIEQVPANDIEAAVKFFNERVADGTWDGDMGEVLLNRQRDPDALLAALGATSADHSTAVAGNTITR